MIGKGLGPIQLGGYVIWGRQRQSITLERVAKDTTPKKNEIIQLTPLYRFTQSLMAIYANQLVPRTRLHRGLSR